MDVSKNTKQVVRLFLQGNRLINQYEVLDERYGLRNKELLTGAVSVASVAVAPMQAEDCGKEYEASVRRGFEEQDCDREQAVVSQSSLGSCLAIVRKDGKSLCCPYGGERRMRIIAYWPQKRT